MDKFKKYRLIECALQDPKIVEFIGTVFAPALNLLQRMGIDLPVFSLHDRYTLDELKQKFSITDQEIEEFKIERQIRTEQMLEDMADEMIAGETDAVKRQELIANREALKQHIADIYLFQNLEKAKENLKREHPEWLKGI